MASSASVESAKTRSVSAAGMHRRLLRHRAHSARPAWNLRARAARRRPRAAQSADLGVDDDESEPEPEDDESFLSLLLASCLSAPDFAEASISRLRLDVP